MSLLLVYVRNNRNIKSTFFFLLCLNRTDIDQLKKRLTVKTKNKALLQTI